MWGRPHSPLRALSQMGIIRERGGTGGGRTGYGIITFVQVNLQHSTAASGILTTVGVK